MHELLGISKAKRNQGFEPTRKSVDQSPDPCLDIDSNLDKLLEEKLNEVLGQ